MALFFFFMIILPSCFFGQQMAQLIMYLRHKEDFHFKTDFKAEARFILFEELTNTFN
jgi:hypothetical protein